MVICYVFLLMQKDVWIILKRIWMNVFFIIQTKLDDPEMWIKANLNIGLMKFVSLEKLSLCLLRI